MKTPNSRFLWWFFTFSIACAACTKKSDLEKIPDSSLRTLNSIEDAQALLDYTVVMRETPSLIEISADDFYLSSDSTIDPVEVDAYLWNREIEGNALTEDWFQPYQQVYYANSVLASLEKLREKSTREQLDAIKGAALFIRSYAFYNVALEFAELYGGNADTDRGVPLRQDPDPETSATRASVKETYELILKNVKEAAGMLPQQVDPNRKNRPTAPAALALLARIYLSMGDWTNAQLYADSCLKRYSKLMDYKSLIPTSVNPFSPNNEEVLYQTNLRSTTNLFNSSSFFVDSILYASFSDKDLRKSLFFTSGNSGSPAPQYSYSGDLIKFSGLAIDEVFLIRAECNARMGYKDEALTDIKTLLQKRWNGAYVLPSLSSQAEVLNFVLKERRKELVFRGLRWIDIRRLNKIDPAIALKRLWFGQEHTLPAEDKRYVLPIPSEVIQKNTSITQNQRY